jgi:chromosome segregation ATPase
MPTFHGCCLAVLLAMGCGTKDNSADTDQATKQLRAAQGEVDESRKALAKNQDDIEATKRALASEQQALLDKQKLVEQQQQQLGSAQSQLQQARLAYGAAVKERFAKLEAALASLETRTDARSRDAVTGLRARRDQLAATLGAMTGTPDPGWNEYTKDVDTTFDAIERDLRAAE